MQIQSERAASRSQAVLLGGAKRYAAVATYVYAGSFRYVRPQSSREAAAAEVASHSAFLLAHYITHIGPMAEPRRVVSTETVPPPYVTRRAHVELSILGIHRDREEREREIRGGLECLESYWKFRR